METCCANKHRHSGKSDCGERKIETEMLNSCLSHVRSFHLRKRQGRCRIRSVSIGDERIFIGMSPSWNSQWRGVIITRSVVSRRRRLGAVAGQHRRNPLHERLSVKRQAKHPTGNPTDGPLQIPETRRHESTPSTGYLSL